MLAKPQQRRVMNLEDAPESYNETSFDGVGMPSFLLSSECSGSFSLLILTISEPICFKRETGCALKPACHLDRQVYIAGIHSFNNRVSMSTEESNSASTQPIDAILLSYNGVSNWIDGNLAEN
jgi:hypothetical protein